MPTYTCHVPSGLLDATKRAAVARAITDAHADATGAPTYFAQVLFQVIPADSWFIGGEPLAHDHLFVHGRIRSGRSPEVRRMLLDRLVADVASAADLRPFSVWVYVGELVPAAMAEFGRILPEPGEEGAWAASFPDEERRRMTSFGRRS